MVSHEDVFEDREIYQPDTEIVRKPKLRRLRSRDMRHEGDLVECHIRPVCKTVGCETKVSGKPFCIDHLDSLPYIKLLKCDLGNHRGL